MAPPGAGHLRPLRPGPAVAGPDGRARRSGVPVADPVLETDARWLGAPFIVMPRMDGHIVGALAHRDRGCAGLDPAQRGRVYDGFLATLATIHRADPDCGPRRAPSGQRRRAGLLGGVPLVVDPRPAGAGPGRGPRLVPGAPSGRRAGRRPAVGGRPAREHGARRRRPGPGRARLGHDLGGGARARPGLVHQPRLHHAPAVREADRRVPRPRRDGGPVRGAERPAGASTSSGTRRWPWCGARPS